MLTQLTILAGTRTALILAAVIIIISAITSENQRIKRREKIAACTETTTATVTATYRKSLHYRIAVYQYAIPEQSENQEESTHYITDTSEFNPDLISISENDKLEIRYNPSNKSVYVPDIECTTRPSTKGHVLSQTLRFLILIELIILIKFV